MNAVQDSLNQPDPARVGDAMLSADRILAVGHVAPDGDAIGSLLGLGWLLQAQGKSVTLACQDRVPENCTWLPGSDMVKRSGSGDHDLVVSLDSSDRRRVGTVLGKLPETTPLINIDHHVTNTGFGAINWVDPSSVATAQMILTLAGIMAWEVTRSAATCLLTGIVTDTRGFRTSNVDTAALSAALHLVDAGASLSEVTRRALEQRSLSTIRLWGEAIDGLHLDNDILWTDVTRSLRKRWAIGEENASGLTNLLTSVREARIVVVFTERNGGIIDVGMRAVPGTDVAQVALSLGGGGHPQAAGCTLEGDLSATRDVVLSALRKSLAEQASTQPGSSIA